MSSVGPLHVLKAGGKGRATHATKKQTMQEKFQEQCAGSTCQSFPGGEGRWGKAVVSSLKRPASSTRLLPWGESKQRLPPSLHPCRAISPPAKSVSALLSKVGISSAAITSSLPSSVLAMSARASSSEEDTWHAFQQWPHANDFDNYRHLLSLFAMCNQLCPGSWVVRCLPTSVSKAR